MWQAVLLHLIYHAVLSLSKTGNYTGCRQESCIARIKILELGFASVSDKIDSFFWFCSHFQFPRNYKTFICNYQLFKKHKYEKKRHCLIFSVQMENYLTESLPSSAAWFACCKVMALFPSLLSGDVPLEE